MAQPPQQQQFATAEEKRELLSGMLDDYLGGENRLQQRLVYAPVLLLAPPDRERLLARLMKEPSHTAIVQLTSDMLCSPNPRLADHLTDDELDMHQEAAEGTPPRLTLHFLCFDPPSGDLWSAFYDEYSGYLLHDTHSMRRLKHALERNWPLEVAYTMYQDRIVRFLILEPFPRDQQGARIAKQNK